MRAFQPHVVCIGLGVPSGIGSGLGVPSGIGSGQWYRQ